MNPLFEFVEITSEKAFLCSWCKFSVKIEVFFAAYVYMSRYLCSPQQNIMKEYIF